MISAFAIDRVGRSSEGKVPLEEVRLKRLGRIIGGRRPRKFSSLANCILRGQGSQLRHVDTTELGTYGCV